MKFIEPTSWKSEMPVFREASKGYYEGTIPRNSYKGTSGLFGSYAQKAEGVSMLRLRMTAGRLTKAKLAYIADSIRKYDVKRAHFTTCEAVQLHDLGQAELCDIMEGGLDVGIVTMGGGGDFPRNTMCSPLSGVEVGEYFDVLPYAEAVGAYMMHVIKLKKMPRKLKICFSNSSKNIPHATFRDMGFIARPDGKFDIFSAGGLGNNPSFGVQIAEAVDPSKILYYCKAMYLTFCAYGNYENRGRARTRFMVETCGGPEGYKKAFLEKLDEVIASGEELDLTVEPIVIDKKGNGSIAGPRIIPQKQDGLYAVEWHPIGGMPAVDSICKLSDTIADMESVEVRLAPYESAYIINLTAEEAEKVIAATPDSAETEFEHSVACIGSSTCQIGLRDSQALLAACVAAVKAAGIPDGALPQIHISGCPSSCGTHQTGAIGFRGASKKVDDKNQAAFMLYVGGNDLQGQEKMGAELGTILETQIPAFLVELGQKVAASGMAYEAWREANAGVLEAIAAPYLA